ncbi:Lar family restriction alleviation protein [Bradyrhizobium jicamae]|uniref:Lar family restriction alleviation protein n=1 Tax=Bradyrhizobium jicamae TaxID=280332 RepID=UPI0009FB1CA0
MPRKLAHSAAIDPLHGFPVSVQPLQPCPFCGGSEVWINSDIVPKFVACRKCWAFGPSAPTVTQAAERWNKRATPPGTNTAAATSG